MFLQLGDSRGSRYGSRSRGEPSSGSQDFNQIRQECLANGVLFEDPEFPATDSSLYFSRRPDRHVEWRRPMVKLYKKSQKIF